MPGMSEGAMLRMEPPLLNEDSLAKLVVGGVAEGQGLGLEGDLEVVVEIGAVRGYPLECPAETPGECLQLGERRARDGGEGDVALTEMGGDAVEVVGPERAVLAADVP